MLSLQSDLQIQKIVDIVRTTGFKLKDDFNGIQASNDIEIEALGIYTLVDEHDNELVRRVIALRQDEYNAIRPVYLTDKETPRLSEVACGPSLFMVGDLEESVRKFNQKTNKRGKQHIQLIARI